MEEQIETPQESTPPVDQNVDVPEIVVEGGPEVEPTVETPLIEETQPIPNPEPESSSEWFDLDERGFDDDVPLFHQDPVSTQNEIPKEIVAAAAASGFGAGCILLIILIVALVVGLVVGLGTGIGVGVGLGLQTCANPVVLSTSPAQPFCFDSIIDRYPLIVTGSNFIQTFDENGVLLHNPTVTAATSSGSPLAFNLTSLVQQNCSSLALTGSNCAIMNTTGISKSMFSFTDGIASIGLTIQNKECLLPKSSTTNLYANQMAVTRSELVCISNVPGDAAFSPTVKLIGSGFLTSNDDSIGFSKTVANIGGVGALPLTAMDKCTSPAGANFKACTEASITLSGATFAPWVEHPVALSYTGGESTCSSTAATIWAPTYAKVTAVTPNTFTCREFGPVTLTGTDFTRTTAGVTVATTFFLRDASNPNAALIAATSQSVTSATSATATWSGLSGTVNYVVVTDNLFCKQVQNAVTITKLGVTVRAGYTISEVSANCPANKCDGGISYPAIPITTAGSLANPVKVTFTNGAPVPVVRTYTMTATGLNSGTFSYPGGDQLKGTWSVQVENADGCATSPYPGLQFK